jgi:hypothetical protein
VRHVEGGLDLSRERTTQAIRSAALELEHLRKLLAAQDAAKLHAQSVAAGLQREVKSYEIDNARLRNELRRIQDQLAAAKQDHSNEISAAHGRESGLRKDLADTRERLTRALEKISGRGRKKLIVALSAGVTALVLAAATQIHPGGTGAAGSGQPETAGQAVAGAAQPATNAVSRMAGPATPATRDFAGAMDRLDDALGHFRGEKVNDVLLRVHLANLARGVDVCSFEWNNGQISMLFGRKPGADINKAMVACADAVEKAAK